MNLSGIKRVLNVTVAQALFDASQIPLHQPPWAFEQLETVASVISQRFSNPTKVFSQLQAFFTNLEKAEAAANLSFAGRSYSSGDVLRIAVELASVDGIGSTIKRLIDDPGNTRGAALELLMANQAAQGNDLVVLSCQISAPSGKTNADFVFNLRNPADAHGLPLGTQIFVDTKASWNSVTPEQVARFFAVSIEQNGFPRTIVANGFHPDALAAVVKLLIDKRLAGKGQILDADGKLFYPR